MKPNRKPYTVNATTHRAKQTENFLTEAFRQKEHKVKSEAEIKKRSVLAT